MQTSAADGLLCNQSAGLYRAIRLTSLPCGLALFHATNPILTMHQARGYRGSKLSSQRPKAVHGQIGNAPVSRCLPEHHNDQSLKTHPLEDRQEKTALIDLSLSKSLIGSIVMLLSEYCSLFTCTTFGTACHSTVYFSNTSEL